MESLFRLTLVPSRSPAFWPQPSPISNRYNKLLESPVTHTKQTTAPRSNRYKIRFSPQPFLSSSRVAIPACPPRRPSNLQLPASSFLIHCPELDADITRTKQTPDPISNHQFLAFLKSPDTSPTHSSRDLHSSSRALFLSNTLGLVARFPRPSRRSAAGVPCSSSNRYSKLLENPVSDCKQSVGSLSNRYRNTVLALARACFSIFEFRSCAFGSPAIPSPFSDFGPSPVPIFVFRVSLFGFRG